MLSEGKEQEPNFNKFSYDFEQWKKLMDLRKKKNSSKMGVLSEQTRKKSTVCFSSAIIIVVKRDANQRSEQWVKSLKKK